MLIFAARLATATSRFESHHLGGIGVPRQVVPSKGSPAWTRWLSAAGTAQASVRRIVCAISLDTDSCATYRYPLSEGFFLIVRHGRRHCVTCA